MGGLQVFGMTSQRYSGGPSGSSGFVLYGASRGGAGGGSGSSGSGASGSFGTVVGGTPWTDYLAKMPRAPIGFGAKIDQRALRAWRRQGIVEFGPEYLMAHAGEWGRGNAGVLGRLLRMMNRHTPLATSMRAVKEGPGFNWRTWGRDEFYSNAKVFSPYAVEQYRKANYSVPGWYGASTKPLYMPNGSGGLTAMPLKSPEAMAAIMESRSRMAAQAMYAESARIIAAHRAFNAQLIANYRAAVAMTGGSAGAVGNGQANPFNPIGANTTPTGLMTSEQIAAKEAARKARIALNRQYGRNNWRHMAINTAGHQNARARFHARQQAMYEGLFGGGTYYGNALDNQEALLAANAARQSALMRGGMGRGRLTGGRYRRTFIPKNIAYKVLGPSMLDGGGLGVASMLQGMGVMYGITGLGRLFGGALSDYANYNNLMQTTMNILHAHDTSANFHDNFVDMAHTVRRVGVETKFTAPEVADAAKFLAMAGFKIPDIKAAIRPIADIALVGDTDLGTTADLVTNIMTAYGIGGGQVRNAADIMTNTFTMSNTTLTEMAEAYKYAAGLLHANGVSFQESAGALGVLGNAGIKGSQAGTTMRTIMANLRKPTKNQLGSWTFDFKKEHTINGQTGKSYTVQRTDANGNIRNLVDIFGDLAKVDRILKEEGGPGINMYTLFHKTAASGAMALMAQVDTWNDIIAQNFMSDGMVEKLANAKKNTISGLWAQLTSMFTEDAMRSFEGVDGTIRGFLQSGINILDPSNKNGGAEDVRKTLTDIIGLLDDVKGVSGQIFGVWRHLGGFVMTFFKAQMRLMPFILALRGIRSIQNIGMGAYSGARSIGGWMSGIGGLAPMMMPGFMGRWLGGPHTVGRMALNMDRRTSPYRFGNGRYTLGQMLFGNAGTGRGTSITPEYRRYQRLYRIGTGLDASAHPRLYNSIYNEWSGLNDKYTGTNGAYAARMRQLRLFAMRRQVLNPLMGGAGAMGGMAGGSILGAMAAESLGASQGGFGQMAGAIGGGMIGMGLGSSLLGGLGTAIAAHPLVAAIMALVAILGVVIGRFVGAKRASDKFFESSKRFDSILDSEGNLNLSNTLSDMQKRYEILDSTQLSLNQKKEKYLELLRAEEDIAKNNAGATAQEVAPALASYLNNRSDILNRFWMWGSDDKERLIGLTPNQMGLGHMDFLPTLSESNLLTNPFTGRQNGFSWGTSMSRLNQRAIANIMYYHGASDAPGTPFADIYDKWKKNLAGITSQSELDAVLNEIQAEAMKFYGEADWTVTGEGNVDKVLQRNPRKNPFAAYGLLLRAYDIINNPQNKWRNIANSALALGNKAGAGGDIGYEASRFFNAMGVTMPGVNTLNPYMANGTWFDPYSTEFEKNMGLNGARWTSQRAQQDANNFIQLMMKNIGMLNPYYQRPLRDWLTNSHFYKMAGYDYVPDNAAIRSVGDSLLYNGKNWRYIYDDSNKQFPVYRFAVGQGQMPEGLAAEYTRDQFLQFQREGVHNQYVDPAWVIPQGQDDFASPYSEDLSGVTSYHAPVKIENMPITIQTSPEQDKEMLAELFVDTMKTHMSEIMFGALGGDNIG